MIEPSSLVICGEGRENACISTCYKLSICEDYDVIIYECIACGKIHTHYFGDMI